MLLERRHHFEAIVAALREVPVCVLVGPRQCGKTTLARQVAARGKAHWFDLETASARRALENPELALSELKGLVVIDEVQRAPGVFAALRPLVDRPDNRARFLLLGSAAPALVQGVSESLAGRSRFLELTGFGLDEVGGRNVGRLWLRGGFPRSYLPADVERSVSWREDFIRSFLERDVPLLGSRVAPEALRRFWLLLAHYHGQVWNAAELARGLGVTPPVARNYLDLLVGTYMVRQLPPWFENLGKRQIKSPKVYLRDSGLLHSLLGIETRPALLSRPQLGASWEGFALEGVVSASRSRDAYFWATQSGAELDLLLLQGGRRFGVEFKVNDAPALTKSMHIALADLKLTSLQVVYPGTRRYRLAPTVEVVPLSDAISWAAAL